MGLHLDAPTRTLTIAPQKDLRKASHFMLLTEYVSLARLLGLSVLAELAAGLLDFFLGPQCGDAYTRQCKQQVHKRPPGNTLGPYLQVFLKQVLNAPQRP